MAHFAELDENNKVLRVIVVGNDICGEPTLGFPETCAAGRAYIANTLKLGGNWRQTSYNSSFRGKYAGVDFTYDTAQDVFIPPQPFASWTLDANYDWQPPTPCPVDGQFHYWDEESLSWKVYSE